MALRYQLARQHENMSYDNRGTQSQAQHRWKLIMTNAIKQFGKSQSTDT